MFRRILIANRGEIACRIIETARRMAITTAAVYSEADADARHVRLADEAVLIGPARADRSYLAIERIIDAARSIGAEAIHPGYGFLSENAEFAEACDKAGLTFIGPPAEAIRAMGSKSVAKNLAERANVPVVPGYHGDRQEPAFLQSEASRIGYPLLIKAVAGGGGKGMRTVDRPEDFMASLEACRREAIAAFGDGRLLLERYIARPRHVEMQIFADSQGNAVHLFERDCSIQRRHQKVLEEAPAPGISDGLRAQMGEAAIAIARAAGYVGAGTVEFIVDHGGDFYFIEMNTRLQVEHPVTEMITGLDLVEWQLRVAAGERLPLRQEEIAFAGHAIETRVYAEDPAKGFLPSSGRLSYLALPPETKCVRLDRGVDSGDEITSHYDPLIAKLIVLGEDRERARARLRQALAELYIVGVANNVEFLARLVASPAFAAGDLSTDLIEREASYLLPGDVEAPNEVYLAGALAMLLFERDEASAKQSEDAQSPWRQRDGWRLNARYRRELTLLSGKAQKTVRALYRENDYELEIDGTSMPAQGRLGAGAKLTFELGGVRRAATVVMSGSKIHVFLGGRAWQLSRVDPFHKSIDSVGHHCSVVAPMPGRIIALLSEPGAWVEQRTPLLILEAMKMEHTMTAPCAGTLKAYHFRVGDQVSEGQELVELEENTT